MPADRVIRKRDAIIIPSSQKYLRAVDDYLERKLRRAGLDRSLVADLAISVSEAVNNAIQHGNKGDPSKKVTVRCALENRRVTIEIEDQGAGFDPAALPNPLEEANLLKEVGRGIFIVKKLVDELSFTPAVGGAGMVVRLVKFLSAAGGK